MVVYEQKPAEMRRYEQAITNDTIQGQPAFAISPSGPTLNGQIDGSTTTSILVSGLTAGVTYDLSVQIVGVSGQHFKNCLTFKCVDC